MTELLKRQYRKQLCSVLIEMLDGLYSNVKGWKSCLPQDSHQCKQHSYFARHSFSFSCPAIKVCISMTFIQPGSAWAEMAGPGAPACRRFSICHCSALQHTSKIGTWQTKLTECIAKQNILPSPDTGTACYRALANS